MEREAAGVDQARLLAWAQSDRQPFDVPTRASRFVGGHSNLTYLLEADDGRRWVLRRPPLHHVVESAHDVGREQRIMRALADTAVPVPNVVAYCDDVEVIGAPFFVMDHVDGAVVRRPEDAEHLLDPEVRGRLGIAFIDTLAALHAVDVDAVGLGGLGRREGYFSRQLRRWHRQWGTTSTREAPLVDVLHAELSRIEPPQREVSLVHGDYRLDNCIVGADATIAAVLDWELSTLGDPLADLGTAVAYWLHLGEEPYEGIASPSRVEGFPSRDQLIARYVETSGRDVSELPAYVALACWKVAIILEGVAARYAAGAMGASAADPARIRGAADRLLERAHAGLSAHRV